MPKRAQVDLTLRPLRIGLLALAVNASVLGPAGAVQCAKEPVTASGEPASYEWLALLKAKGNWRKKTRALPDLGPAYATWNLSKEKIERCIRKPESIVCTVTSVPCRN